MYERSRVQRKRASDATVEVARQPQSDSRASRAIDGIVRSGGLTLASGDREWFEAGLGHDFSQVRIHADAAAASAVQDVGALAYTLGQDIVFGEGQYAPESLEGRWLLAHELTHVAQQGGEVQGLPSAEDLAFGEPGDAFEVAADAAADAMMVGGPAGAVAPASAAPGVQLFDLGGLVGGLLGGGIPDLIGGLFGGGQPEQPQLPFGGGMPGPFGGMMGGMPGPFGGMMGGMPGPFGGMMGGMPGPFGGMMGGLPGPFGGMMGGMPGPFGGMMGGLPGPFGEMMGGGLPGPLGGLFGGGLPNPFEELFG